MDKPSSPTFLRRSRNLTLLLFGLLIVSRLVVLVPGFIDLASGRGGVDLKARRAELEFARHGIDPNLAYQRLRVDRAAQRGDVHQSEFPLETLPTRSELKVGMYAERDLNSVNASLAPYPHWSYPLSVGFIWPSLPSTRLYYAVLLAISLAGFLWWALREEAGEWRWLALLVCLIPAPSWAVGVFAGQYSLPIMLMLALYLSALKGGRWGLAGLLLGFAAIKPTSAALFAVALLSPVFAKGFKLRGPVRATAVAGSMIVSSSLLMWWWVGTSPFAALGAIASSNSGTGQAGYGVSTILVRWGFESAVILNALALAGFVIACSVPWLMRRYSLLTQFAVLGVLSRLWTYHRHYDDVLLVFLLLALLQQCKRGSLASLAALICMAMSLATPRPETDSQEVLRVAVWVLSTLVLVWEARNSLEESQNGVRSEAEPMKETESASESSSLYLGLSSK